ncbi:hypothetical protein KY338_01970 [Candidatus Woesearchaeota archaeon]|nr:hypothetical protein [Candidatus Woesearchaeota archaeon]MBW3005956.1 hypothetical protein [Candidatus Woesearchaeota archaeon]
MTLTSWLADFFKSKNEYSMYEIASRIVRYQGTLFFERNQENKTVFRNNLAKGIADMECCLEKIISCLKSEKDGLRHSLKDRHLLAKEGLVSLHEAEINKNLKYIRKQGLDWFGDADQYKYLYAFFKNKDSGTPEKKVISHIVQTIDLFINSQYNAEQILQTTRNLKRSVSDFPGQMFDEWLYYFFDKMKKSLFWHKDCSKFMNKIYGEELVEESGVEKYALIK